MNPTPEQTATIENQAQRLDDVLNRLIEFDSGGLPEDAMRLDILCMTDLGWISL
jgi:hypothetical protein